MEKLLAIRLPFKASTIPVSWRDTVISRDENQSPSMFWDEEVGKL